MSGLLAILLAAAPFSLSVPPSNALGLGGRQLQTSGALSLYVSPAGNDASACTSPGAGACLTPEGATLKIPPGVADPVNVYLSCDTFDAGAYTVGFTKVFRDPSVYTVTNGPYIRYNGCFLDAGVTGAESVTGTIASATQSQRSIFANRSGASGDPAVWGTASVVGGNYDAGEQVGNWFLITTGTGAGELAQIYSHDAGVFTIYGTWDILPDATSQYQLVTPGTKIVGFLNQPTGASGFGFRNSAVTASWIVGGNMTMDQMSQANQIGRAYTVGSALVGGPADEFIAIQGVNFAPAGGGLTAAVAVGPGASLLLNADLFSADPYAGVQQSDDSYVRIHQCQASGFASQGYMLVTNSAFASNIGAPHGCQTVLDNSRAIVQGPLASIAGCSVAINQSQWNGTGGANGPTGVILGDGANVYSAGNLYTQPFAASACVRTGSPSAPALAALQGVGINFTSVSDEFDCSIGVEADRFANVFFAGIAGNAAKGDAGTGIVANKGSRVEFQVPSIINSATADLSIDGQSMSYTQLRGVSPKCNTRVAPFDAGMNGTFWGTYVCED